MSTTVYCVNNGQLLSTTATEGTYDWTFATRTAASFYRLNIRKAERLIFTSAADAKAEAQAVANVLLDRANQEAARMQAYKDQIDAIQV